MAYLLMVGSRLREALEGRGAAVDDRFRLRSDCSVQGIEQMIRASPVTVADAQSGQVDQGFQGVPGVLRAQGLGAQDGLGVTPAQRACQVRHAAVARDQRRLVQGNGRGGHVAVALGGGSEVGDLADPFSKGRARWTWTGNEREPLRYLADVHVTAIR
ncbi:hypothetical protein [Streptomyces spongiicola]|uniref:hypothetical protein n=1 Tax=Streptomyces spongiicola TaxID=1690221 RepID=UPI0013A589CA|nr:hypothetical protein [Streptomyces spongiicola]